jgi:hypothetical protein
LATAAGVSPASIRPEVAPANGVGVPARLLRKHQPAFWLKVNAWQRLSPRHAYWHALSVVCLMIE